MATPRGGKQGTGTRAMLAVLMGTLMVTTAWAAAAGAAGDQATTAPQAPHYVDVADEAGLDFTCGAWSKDLGLAPRFFISVFFCPSPVIADFNGDGYQDVLFPNQRYTDAAVNEERDPQDQLYLNNGDGTFRDVTGITIPHDTGNSMAAAPIDVDGDGDLDIYVANYHMDKFGVQSPSTTIYINNGDGTFTSHVPPGLTTRPVNGVQDSQFGSAVAIADYDKDGDLDIYRGNYAVHPFPSGMPAALQLTTPETNLLYENQGDGTFQDVTFETGASILPGRTFAVNFVDVNHDTWPDLYVANDENPNELYLNVPGENPGERVFEFEGGTSGADDGRGAMCSEATDFDNDGNLDLYMSHYESEANGYYLGNGDGTFENAENLGDLMRGYHLLGWGCPGFDMENDGDRDLFVANGHMVPSGGEFFEEGPPGAGEDDNGYALPNLLFRNTLVETGEHSWEDIGATSGPALEARRVSSGAQAFDVELDGTQEILVVNNNDATPNLLKNTAATGHWLSLELRGAGTNTHAIGAQVQVEAGDLTLHDQMITGDTLASGSVMPLHFGLGEETGPATVTVTWPDGTTQTETVAIDQHVRIVQDQGVALDTLAPQVQLATDAEPNEAGWYTQDPLTVDLTVQDRGQGEISGVADVRYRVDDGPIVPYTGSFQITGDGTHTVTVFTSDEAGNEAWFPYELKLDATDPEGELTSPEEGQVVVQERNVADAPSGQTTMLSAVHTPQGPAKHTDLALEGVAHETERNTGVDPGPIPVSVHEAQMGTAGSDGRTSVQVDASDATSGVDRVEFLLDGELKAVDRSEPYGWNADLRGQALGEHTLTARVVDGAGLATTDELVFEVVPNTPDGAFNSAKAGPGELAAQGTSTSKQAPATDPGLEEHRKQAILSALGPRSQVTGYETDAPPQYMNGVSSYIMANTRDAPIWRQFSFIPDSKAGGNTLGQYTVLNMETFLATDGVGKIYQFPECQTLSPVLSDPVRKPLPSGGEDREWDQPIRQIVDVVLDTDCAYQPTSQDQVEEMAVSQVAREMYVNAPKVPDQLMDWSDERFFNAPPFRPRIPAYQEGDVAQFLTYEASWVAPWTGIKMPGTQDVFILSPTPTFRPDFTIFNVNVGAPMHEDFEKYSPLWVGNCIVDKDNKKCMISVNKKAGYEQCRTVTECMNMDRDGDNLPDVLNVAPNTWTHVNCPFVAIDTNGNDIIEPWEELYFPDLWVDGPVTI